MWLIKLQLMQIMNKIKYQKYHTVGTAQNPIKTAERGKIDILTQIYMTAHFHGLIRALQLI
jgi:hypothetical protein